jgi:hypothetical protein
MEMFKCNVFTPIIGRLLLITMPKIAQMYVKTSFYDAHKIFRKIIQESFFTKNVFKNFWRPLTL